MTGPGWLAGTLAAVMLSVAAYCASRLICARPRGRATERDVDTAHGAGVAMAGMLVPSLGLLPGGMWKAAFAAAAGWFASRSIRARRRAAARTPPLGHYLPHLTESGAMLYMLVAVPAARAAGVTAADMGGPGGGGFGAGAFVFALFLLGYAVWTADRFTALRAPAPGPPVTGLPVTGPPPSPRGWRAAARSRSPLPWRTC